MAMTTTAAAWATKWANNYSAAGAQMAAGANALATAPGVSATTTDAEAKMRTKWLAALTSGKWHNNTVSVSLADWKNAYINKGIPNAQNSVAIGKTKVNNYAAKAIPVYNGILSNIDQMPNATLADSIARAAAWMTQLQAASQAGQLN